MAGPSGGIVDRRAMRAITIGTIDDLGVARGLEQEIKRSAPAAVTGLSPEE